jgi:predicted metal-dependent hydrolase
MAMTTVFFTFFNIVHYVQLSRDMPEKTDWRSIGKGMGWLLGRKGVLRKLGPAYLSYYRRGFHPAQKDGSALREKGLRKLAEYLDRPELLDALA